jgi:hypothetical protein
VTLNSVPGHIFKEELEKHSPLVLQATLSAVPRSSPWIPRRNQWNKGGGTSGKTQVFNMENILEIPSKRLSKKAIQRTMV